MDDGAVEINQVNHSIVRWRKQRQPGRGLSNIKGTQARAPTPDRILVNGGRSS
jgi:hypothetical protein